jgi:hypothetical protein
VDELEFVLDPDGEATNGLKVYQNIKRETGYRNTQLLNFTYNRDYDITEAVKNKKSEWLTLD